MGVEKIIDTCEHSSTDSVEGSFYSVSSLRPLQTGKIKKELFYDTKTIRETLVVTT